VQGMVVQGGAGGGGFGGSRHTEPTCYVRTT